MGLLVEAVQARLRGDRDERMRVEVRVRDPEHQVDRARAEGGQADARAARERAVGVGHERGAALVPRRDEPDRASRRARRSRGGSPRPAGRRRTRPPRSRGTRRAGGRPSVLPRAASISRQATGRLRLSARQLRPADGYARPMEFRDVVRHRRMVRRFDQRPVPRETIDRIIDVGRRGSVGRVLARARAPRPRHARDGRHVLGDDPRSRSSAGRKRPSRTDRPC